MRNQTISSLSTEYNATLQVLLIIALTCELVHANSMASFATFCFFIINTLLQQAILFVPLEFVLQPLYITKSYYTYFHIAYQITCIYIISILYKSTPKLHVHMYNRFATTTYMETSLLPLCRISYGPWRCWKLYTNKHIKQSIIVSFFCIHILCCFDPSSCPVILLPSIRINLF